MSRIVSYSEGRFDRPCRVYWGAPAGWRMAGWTRDPGLALLFADAREAEAARAAAAQTMPYADVRIEQIHGRP